LAVERAIAYNLAFVIDGLRNLQNPSRIGRNEIIQIEHSCGRPPDKRVEAVGTVIDRTDDLAGIVDTRGITFHAPRQQAEVEHTAFDLAPEHGVVATGAAIGVASDLAEVVNRSGDAVDATPQPAEVLHAGSFRPNEGVGAIAATRVADNLAETVDRIGAAEIVSRQKAKTLHARRLGPQESLGA
jgi:hypothetical protein